MDRVKAVVWMLMLVLGYTQAQDANCDFAQNIVAGRQYTIASPGHPSFYVPGITCRWIATCPVGYNCHLNCAAIELPQSQSCALDRLLISRSGDPQLAAAEYYCGRGSVTAVSTGQRISIGLITSRPSRGGRFSCTLTAQRAGTPQPTQCSCGIRKMSRIVNGQPTRPNEFTMMAGLIYQWERAIRCGATIIDRRYVLTAAHCVNGRSFNELGVVVGEHDITTGNETPSTQGFSIVWYLIHPQYRSDTFDYDIAIIALNGLITYSENVGPACLPFKYASNDFAGEIVTILGWGTQFIGGPASTVLRMADLNVIAQTSCARTMTTLTARQMCTFTQGRDACQDDSGGPLLYTERSTGLLFHVGIVSFGRFCASNDPGVNTRITAVLDWIVSNAPADYCVK